MAFFRRNIDEIAADPVLRAYGVAVALVNVLTGYHWLVNQPLGVVLDPEQAPICWPFFDDCHVLRVLGPDAVTAVVWGLVLLAVGNAALFSKRRFVPAAYWLLLALSLAKAALLFQDYRLRLNQHYMAFWTTFVFLLLADKRRALQYLIVLFYFWAGLLKLNPEWISGEALHGKPPFDMPEWLVPASCVYVIVLEVVIVFGLFARRGWIFWATFAQLLLFHVASYWTVGSFYPVLMFLLLAIFPLARYGPEVRIEEPPGLPALWRRAERPATYVALAVFCLAQGAPFAFPGDSSLTGEGRMFALHMFDAPTECRAVMVFQTEQGERTFRFRGVPFTPIRISCDPIVFFHLARHYCRQFDGLPPLGDARLVLESRKVGREKLHTVVSVGDFCSSDLSYATWRHNPWILPPDRFGSVAPQPATP